MAWYLVKHRDNSTFSFIDLLHLTWSTLVIVILLYLTFFRSNAVFRKMP